MSEIEKMYSNVGIKCLHPSGFCKHIGATCEVCERHKYPPFTAEKQLELIKWLVRNQDIFKITYHREFLWCSDVEWVESDCYEEFEESLAGLINKLWTDLTPEEKQQVKGILE